MKTLANIILTGIWPVPYKNVCEITENAKCRNVKLQFYCRTLQLGILPNPYLLTIHYHLQFNNCQTAVRFSQHLQQSVQSYSLLLFAPTTVSSPSKLSSWSQKSVPALFRQAMPYCKLPRIWGWILEGQQYRRESKCENIH